MGVSLEAAITTVLVTTREALALARYPTEVLRASR